MVCVQNPKDQKIRPDNATGLVRPVSLYIEAENKRKKIR
jgi:hypothetical protein